jgi:hypothetical protein
MAITAEALDDEDDVPLAVLSADTAAAIEQLRVDARAAAEASRAPSSERAYAADWRDFCAFAARIDRTRLPAEAETVALYVADLTRRGRRPATIARKLAAIAVYHRSLDHPTPTDHDVVRAVVRGTRRQLGVAQPQKTALELDALRSVILGIPADLRGLRDRALLGFDAQLWREGPFEQSRSSSAGKAGLRRDLRLLETRRATEHLRKLQSRMVFEKRDAPFRHVQATEPTDPLENGRLRERSTPFDDQPCSIYAQAVSTR